mmetsp:Transcript_27581/g.65453  ORF Transcript_27581/g.65453 Transcript_27581/m.65453 type:complete len:182 (-) Transcript_27581:482-1027(-)
MHIRAHEALKLSPSPHTPMSEKSFFFTPEAFSPDAGDLLHSSRQSFRLKVTDRWIWRASRVGAALREGTLNTEAERERGAPQQTASGEWAAYNEPPPRISPKVQPQIPRSPEEMRGRTNKLPGLRPVTTINNSQSIGVKTDATGEKAAACGGRPLAARRALQVATKGTCLCIYPPARGSYT